MSGLQPLHAPRNSSPFQVQVHLIVVVSVTLLGQAQNSCASLVKLGAYSGRE